MPRPPDNDPSIDSLVLLIAFVLLLFASPVAVWWSGDGRLWYLPYLLWGAAIGLGAWLFRQRDESGHGP